MKNLNTAVIASVSGGMGVMDTQLLGETARQRAINDGTRATGALDHDGIFDDPGTIGSDGVFYPDRGGEISDYTLIDQGTQSNYYNDYLGHMMFDHHNPVPGPTETIGNWFDNPFSALGQGLDWLADNQPGEGMPPLPSVPPMVP